MNVAPFASSDVSARLEFALDAALQAEELILGYYQSPTLAVESKRDSSPVTAADRGAEELIRKLITREFPADGVLGEEFPETPGTSGYRWILDPVDGTKSFIHGVPLFGTLIGLEYDDRSGNEPTCVAGVCRFPALHEVVYAARGGGAWWKIGDAAPRPATASQVSRLEDATFCVTNPARWEKSGRGDAYQRLLTSVHLMRGWGDCFGHVLVATGRAEIMIDPALNPWDCAALVPILEEAGAVFCDWTGRTTIYSGNGMSIVASLKETVLELLKS